MSVRITDAMSRLDQVTQQAASSSEQLAATAEELRGQSEQLTEIVSFFKIASGAGGEATMSAELPVHQANEEHSKKPGEEMLAPVNLSDFEQF